MAPALEDYEYLYDDTGVLLNSSSAGIAATLPFIDIEKVSGLDSPEFRTSEHDHEGFDGGYIDSEYYKTRTIVLEGTLYADPDNVDEVCDELRYNYRPRSQSAPFYFKHPNKPVRVVFGKGLGARYDIETLRRTGRCSVQLTIGCPDPYIYTADPVVVTGTGQGVDPGHGFNHGFNHGFGGLGTGGNQVDIFNGGNHIAYPVITIEGPISNPSLVEDRTGNALDFEITLIKGSTLIVDTRKHTIMENGTVNRRSSMVPGSRWWGVDPGTSTITLNGIAASSEQFTATAVGTVNTIVGTDTDVGNIAVGDKFRLYNSLGAAIEFTVFEVTNIVTGGGTGTITFTPDAQAATAIGDYIKTGVATFTIELRATWY